MDAVMHEIDWSKVKTVEDVKEVLKGLRITVDPKFMPDSMIKYLKPILDDK